MNNILEIVNKHGLVVLVISALAICGIELLHLNEIRFVIVKSSADEAQAFLSGITTGHAIKDEVEFSKQLKQFKQTCELSYNELSKRYGKRAFRFSRHINRNILGGVQK